MLTAFLTPSKTSQLQKILSDKSEAHMLKNLWLLSPSIHFAFRIGHVHILPYSFPPEWRWDTAEGYSKDGAMTAKFCITSI